MRAQDLADMSSMSECSGIGTVMEKQHGKGSCSQLVHDASTATMQELSILEYSLVHRSAPMKAAGALMAAVSIQTKTLQPYMEEMEVRVFILDPPLSSTDKPSL